MGTQKDGSPDVTDPREEQDLRASDLPDDDHDDPDTEELKPTGRQGDGD